MDSASVVGAIAAVVASFAVVAGATFWAGAMHAKLSTIASAIKHIEQSLASSTAASSEALNRLGCRVENHEVKLASHEIRISSLEERE